MNLLQAQAEWENARATRKESPHTRNAHDADIRVIAQRLAAGTDTQSDPRTLLTLADLTPSRLRRAFADFATDHARTSIARAHSTWSLFCRFCVSEGLLAADPMLAVDRPRVPKRTPKPLAPVGPDGSTEDTAMRLVTWLMTGQRRGYDVWPERDRATVLLLLTTGVRSAEACGLNLRDLNGEPGERRITVTGKGEKTRSVPIEEEVHEFLQELTRQREQRFGSLHGSDPLLVDRHGRRLSAKQLSYIVSQCCRQAGVGDALPHGAVAHALRHTYATLLAQNGASASELMALMGHASMATSQGYIDASARELRTAAAALPVYRALRGETNPDTN